jgi:hypothetical protein
MPQFKITDTWPEFRDQQKDAGEPASAHTEAESDVTNRNSRSQGIPMPTCDFDDEGCERCQ